MSRKDALIAEQLTDSMYYILLSLLTPRHGYAVMKYIGDLTEEAIQIGPATLYTLLKKLSDTEIIANCVDGDDHRKTYSLTEKGKSLIHGELNRRIRMVEHGKKAFGEIKEGAST